MLIAGMLSFVSHNSLAVNADFHGELVEDPCEIVPGTEDQLVEFDMISVKRFYSDPTSDPKPFSIQLQECDISLGKDVKVSFIGTEDSLQTGMLATTGQAKGLAVMIAQADGTIIPINSGKVDFKLQGGNTRLDFQSYLHAEKSRVENKNIELGDLEATATIELEYP